MKPEANSFRTFKDHLEKFITIDEEEFETILKYFTVKKRKRHQILIRVGDSVQHTYWTWEGLLTSTLLIRKVKNTSSSLPMKIAGSPTRMLFTIK